MIKSVVGSLALALALSCSGFDPLYAQSVLGEQPIVEQQIASAARPDAPRRFALAAPQAPLAQIVRSEVKALRSGPLLIHGNYCGIGNRPGSEPIDSLDSACMRHDTCTETGTLPSCACDNRLRTEATAIAQDPDTPAGVQVVAFATAASMTVLICK